MTYFLTKAWGFTEPVGPLVFRQQGWRTNALEKLKAGDLVVLVGTQGDPTLETEQGRLLGIMEPTSEAVMTLDYPHCDRPEDFDDQGKFRWPYGLLNSRAWVLEDRPFLTDISDRIFGRDAISGIVEMTAQEGAAVSKLRKRIATLAKPTAQAELRIERASGRGSYQAPPPTTKRNGVMHLRRARAYTYLMEMIGPSEPCFKIGWAFDWQSRQDTFNHSSLPELGGIQYKTCQHHLWSTARQAFEMEQRLLRQFQSNRHPSNIEVIVGIERRELDEAWFGLVSSGLQQATSV